MPEFRFLRVCLLFSALVMGGADAQAVFTEPSAPGGSLIGLRSVTVQAGDTAFSLARRAGLSVPELLALNQLGSADLKVGQVLILQVTPVTYTVQPGDTLYALARRFGLSVDALLAASTLPPGTVLRVGQVLTLPPSGGTPAPVSPAVTVPAPPVAAAGPAGSPFQAQGPVQQTPTLQLGALMPLPGAASPQGPAAVTGAAAAWRVSALSLLNTPYLLGGTTRTGTDCSGLVLQVFTPLGVTLPRTSAEQARAGQAVSPEALEPGDLVFFDTEGVGRVSHVGIYLGEDQFISANSYQGRVTVDRLRADRYWSPRFVGARRVLAPVTALGR